MNKAILICSPIAQEHIRTYKVIRNIAKSLSIKGYHVLRFDYAGIGDSSGEFADMSIDNWLDNISQACNELVDISGVKKINILGVRLGGTLAVLSGTSLPVEKIVMWDPVVTGSEYLSNLKRMHGEMLTDTMRYSVPRKPEESYSRELLGYIFSEDLLNELANLSIDVSEMCIKDEDSSASNDEQCRDVVFKLKDAENWVDVHKMEDMLLSSKIVPKILDEF